MKRFRILLTVLVVVFLAWMAFFALAPHEPSYAGRSLSSWLRQLDDGDRQGGLPWQLAQTNRTTKQALAAEAIRQMGTNTLPYLLHSLTNRDSDLKLKVMALLAKQPWIKFPPPATNRMHRAAALAFNVLGPAAKGAVPALVKILNQSSPMSSDDSAKCATVALVAINPEGQVALIQIVDSNGWSRTCAIWGLSVHHVTVPPKVIQTLISDLTNNIGGNGSVAAFALGGLGQQYPEQVVPALINGLKSQDPGTRWGSAFGLGDLGTNAVSAIPALSEGLEDPDTTIRNYSKAALKKIVLKADKD